MTPEAEEYRARLREMLPELTERFGVAELGLFGSRVRGDHRGDSDLDVLVTFLPGRVVGLFQFGELEDYLSAQLGLRVDLVHKPALSAGRRSPGTGRGPVSMISERTIPERLADILTEAEFALEFVTGFTRERLAQDPLTLRAVLYCLTVIGEAAGHLPQDVRARAPEVPWKQVVGMRNRLIHDYIRTDYGIVWDTVTDNVPTLLAAVRRLQTQLAAEELPPPPEAPL